VFASPEDGLGKVEKSGHGGPAVKLDTDLCYANSCVQAVKVNEDSQR
jgi:hypothetical protein